MTSSGEDDDDVTDVTVTFDDDEIDKYIDDKMDLSLIVIAMILIQVQAK